MSVNRSQSPKINSKSRERATSQASRYLAVQQILKICQPETDLQKIAIESISRKKISTVNFMESTMAAEKTTKIKKNKKKKKKGLISSQLLKKQKIFRNQLCECCLGKAHLDITPTNDGYDSDSDVLDEDPEDYLSGLIESLVQDNLEKYYDEIDKNLKTWLKGMEKYPAATFVKLMKKLSDTFGNFESDLYEEMQEQEGNTRMLESYCDDITEEFKTYVLTRFPLLKDFIENFPLSLLDQTQNRELRQLTSYNSLATLVLTHIFDIQNKKIKKKNKRKKKKEEKKNLEQKLEKNVENQKQELVQNTQTLIERLDKLKIDDQSRINCFYDKKWLSGLASQLRDRINSSTDT